MQRRETDKMLYPLKFKPIFKNYLWGGRNLEKLNKKLPNGIVAESWEICCHKDGMSVVENGALAGKSLQEIISIYGEKLLGISIQEKFKNKFPLIIKFIDANQNLSVQVHPNDYYAKIYENGENGKNEMWYIISCKPGAKIVYGLKENINKDIFLSSIKRNKINECLNYIEVSQGDCIFVPAGTIHAIGEGIVIAEIQQNSNITYRIYDYDRVDHIGTKRELHIDKAIEVIDFNNTKKYIHNYKIIKEKNSIIKCKIKSGCFNVDLYHINEEIDQISDNRRFFIYVVVEGKGNIKYNCEAIDIALGDCVLMPGDIGRYSINGDMKLLKIYIP